ncbi:Omega-6 fatty acid desaturase, endoplasmic reticulum isozyme 2 [Hordeum vulgare]|nr:Omega-6 fatty acid desaturase, endoplasmic reticulum isozyme 2 [Hordeum vulgare]
MTGSGSKSFTSRSVDHELIPSGPNEEMVVRLALCRFQETAALRQHFDSQRQESTTSTQPVPRSGVAASTETMQSMWRLNVMADTQPLRWRVEDAPWRGVPGSRHERRGRRNRVVVNIVSSQEGSVIDLTSTGTVRVTVSDEEE